MPPVDTGPGKMAQTALVARTVAPKPEIAPEAAKPANLVQAAPDAFAHGRSVAGNARAWTGRVVCLADWRKLSDWEKHGSTGKIWNGLTRQWEPAGRD